MIIQLSVNVDFGRETVVKSLYRWPLENNCVVRRRLNYCTVGPAAENSENAQSPRTGPRVDAAAVVVDDQGVPVKVGRVLYCIIVNNRRTFLTNYFYHASYPSCEIVMTKLFYIYNVFRHNL